MASKHVAMFTSNAISLFEWVLKFLTNFLLNFLAYEHIVTRIIKSNFIKAPFKWAICLSWLAWRDIVNYCTIRHVVGVTRTRTWAQDITWHATTTHQTVNCTLRQDGCLTRICVYISYRNFTWINIWCLWWRFPGKFYDTIYFHS